MFSKAVEKHTKIKFYVKVRSASLTYEHHMETRDRRPRSNFSHTAWQWTFISEIGFAGLFGQKRSGKSIAVSRIRFEGKHFCWVSVQTCIIFWGVKGENRRRSISRRDIQQLSCFALSRGVNFDVYIRGFNDISFFFGVVAEHCSRYFHYFIFIRPETAEIALVCAIWYRKVLLVSS